MNRSTPHAKDKATTTAKRLHRPRWPRRMFGLFVLSLGGLWCAPYLVAWKPVRDRVLAIGLRGFPGQAEVGSLSLGWLSPVTAHNVVVKNAAGQPVVVLGEVRTKQSLAGLAWNSRRPGLVTLASPRVTLVVREGGSNLEDLLAAWKEDVPASPPGAPQQSQLELAIVDGHVDVLDATSGRTWALDRVQLRLTQVQSHTAGSNSGKLECLVADDTQQGPLTAEWSTAFPVVDPSQLAPGAAAPAAAPLGQGQLALGVQGAPLSIVRAALVRSGIAVDAAGVAAARVRVQWEDARQTVDAEQFDVQGLALAAPAWLGRDVLRLDRVNAQGQLVTAGPRWTVRNFRVESDVANGTANGSFLAPQPGQPLAAWLEQSFDQADAEFTGQVDLARLANMLPNVVHLRDQTQLVSGVASLSLRTAPSGEANQERRWLGELATKDLAALRGGRRIAWEQPFAMQAALARSARGPMLERLVCQSDFLQVQAQGSLAEGAAQVRGDLDRLVERAGEFVELTSADLAGQLELDVQWRIDERQQAGLNGSAVVRDFRWTTAGGEVWREPRLQVQLSGAGSVAEGTVRQLDQARLIVEAGDDRLDARLTSPLTVSRPLPPLPVACQLTGRLESWQTRLAASGLSGKATEGWKLAGGVTLQAEATVGPAKSVVAPLQVVFTDFRAESPDLRFDEPRVELKSHAEWDATTRTLVCTQVTLASATLAAGTERFVVLVTDSGTQCDGAVGLRADLGRLLACRRPAETPTTSWHGLTAGQVRLTTRDTMTEAVWNVTVENLALKEVGARRAAETASAPSAALTSASSAAGVLWQEPRVALTGQGTFDLATQSATLAQCDIAANAWSLAAKGQLADLSGRCVADLAGQLAYDWQGLSPNLAAYLGEQVRITGRDTRPFAVRGPLLTPQPSSGTAVPLVPSELVAEASFGWQTLAAYGVEAGPGEVKAKLAEGTVTTAPLDLRVGEGRVKLAPRVALNATPAVLVLDSQSGIENLRLSPELCSTWLKYVAPFVADVTQAEGTFSVQLASARVPLTAPATSDVRGTLAIHGAQIGPGPLSRDVIGLAEQLKAVVERRPPGTGTNASKWLDLPRQQVPFEVAQGRVVHRDLQLVVRDVTIRTQGSVGLDQSLTLQAEAPIRDEWVARERLLAGLRGQSIRIPVNGSLSRPQFDIAALNQLTGQVLRSAAGNLLEQQLNRGLQKLFGPMP